MANRRMFSKSVVQSDDFLDLPISSQALYFHLGMEADDDGFLNCAKKVVRTVGCSPDDLKILIAKGFLISFETGVIVVKHWKENNNIRSDRYHETVFSDEKKQVLLNGGRYEFNGIPSDNQRYTIGIPSDNQRYTIGIPSDNQRYTEVRLGQVSSGKVSEGEDIVNAPAKQDAKHKYGEYSNVLLSDSDIEKLQQEFPDWEERIERLSSYIASKGAKYKNHLATIRNWAKKDAVAKPKVKEYGDPMDFYR